MIKGRSRDSDLMSKLPDEAGLQFSRLNPSIQQKALKKKADSHLITYILVKVLSRLPKLSAAKGMIMFSKVCHHLDHTLPHRHRIGSWPMRTHSWSVGCRAGL